MVYLILSIVCVSSLVLLFKAFERSGVNVFQAIVVNYCVAAILGFSLSKHASSLHVSLGASWLPYSILLGCLFISIFNLIGISTQKLGVSATSVANKMSMIIPVAAAIVLYDDTLGILKICGIVLALAAVYLASVGKMNSEKGKNRFSFLLLPVIFAGSGILDALINYSQKKFSLDSETDLFVSSAFATAAVIGILILIGGIALKKIQFRMKSLAGGIALGIPNYFSMYFLMLALEGSDMQSSVVFPVNNLGVVALSAGLSVLLFGEKLSRANVAGILLSILSIALIALS